MGIIFPFTIFPRIQTDRLVLRELSLADNRELLAIRTNEEINRFVGRSVTPTIAATSLFIEARKQDRVDGKGVYWAIEPTGISGIIGTICYWNLDYATGTAEIGYELLPPLQGKGLMTEAITAVIAYGFNEMALDTITAWPMPQNEPSVRLLERQGFTFWETIDGLLLYKLNKAAWQANLTQ